MQQRPWLHLPMKILSKLLMSLVHAGHSEAKQAVKCDPDNVDPGSNWQVC